MAQLPAENLLQIFNYFLKAPPTFPEGLMNDTRHVPFAVQTLSRLCQVSRRFRLLAEPLLYHTLSIPQLQPARHTLLLRTLIERPALGELIQIIDFQLVFGSLQRFQEAAETLRGWLEDTYSAEFAEYFRQSLTDTWGKGVGEFAFLLVLAPNLRTLEWSIPKDYDSRPEVHKLFSYAAAALTGTTSSLNDSTTKTARVPLAKLKQVHLRQTDYMSVHAPPVSRLGPIVQFPQLETITGFMVEWCGERLLPLDEESRQHNLTGLELTLCGVDEAGIIDVFKRFPALKCLSLCPTPTSYSQYHMDLEGFGNVLRSYGRGLKRLDLDPWAGSGYRNIEGRGKFGSLRDLEDLEMVSIALDVLFGAGAERTALKDLLPRSLVRLVISPSILDEPAGDLLRDLVTSGHCPNLSWILVISKSAFTFDWEDPTWTVKGLGDDRVRVVTKDVRMRAPDGWEWPFML